MGLDAFLVEPHRLEVTQHRLAQSRSALRAVQITDLHLGSVGRLEREVCARINALEPDLILFTGDIVDDNGALEGLQTMLGLIGRDVPKVAVLGNWERWGHVDTRALGELYGRFNGRLLINESMRIGTSIAPARFNSPPEIALLELAVG